MKLDVSLWHIIKLNTNECNSYPGNRIYLDSYKQVKFVTWFAKMDHFCLYICDLIVNKTTVKTYQKTVLHAYIIVMDI